MTSSSSPRFSGMIRDVRSPKQNLQQTFSQPTTIHPATTASEQQSHPTPPPPPPPPPSATANVRSRADSSSASFIDPFHYQALQDTNEALKSEVHRLARADEDHTAKLKLQLQQYSELDQAYNKLQNEYRHLTAIAEDFEDLKKTYEKEKSSNEYRSRENEQFKTQNESLINELARLTQLETRDRSRQAEQADVRRQFEDLFNQHNELQQSYEQLKENYQENQLGYENDIKHFNDEIIKYRLENEQLHSANDLLREERTQMRDSHEATLKKRLDEIKYLQIENRDLQAVRQKYNEERETFQAIDLRKTQLENDLLTMQAVEDRCQDLQSTVERLQTEIQLSQKKSDDHATAVANLNKETARLIKELESASMLNTQMRTEISNATNTNERLSEENERYRTNLLAKNDDYDAKRRENDQLVTRIHEFESLIKSMNDKNDMHNHWNAENEVNKLELKKKQDDYEQFQLMHDATKQEHQETIHLLEEKIYDLERKTELQSLKHEEILLEFESLKTRRDRILPSSTGMILSNNHPSPLPSPQHWPVPTMVDSQTSPTEDTAPVSLPPPALPPSAARPTLKTTASQSIVPIDTPETKLKPTFDNQTAQIVQAKYSYEPLQFSPNDHPEVELPLNVGEYYLVYGEVDEDGFYDGRNLEGRYGLIPSNFIEPVGNLSELPETIRHIIQRLTGKTFSDEAVSPRREQNFSLDSDVFASSSSVNMLTSHRRQLSNTSNSNHASDVSTTNGLSFGKHVPCPTHLRIEKYLTSSVLIAWNPPASTVPIHGYQILLDHALYTTIRANERTRALIENININEKTHRLSIRTISQRGLSRDQECTFLLTMPSANGNSTEVSFIPSDLRVDRINQTSAVVSWWPASNETVHKLFVNDIEVQTLKAGVYRFKLSGLLPNTVHKVTIKAKPTNVNVPAQQQLAASIEFRTTAFDESIEPPKRVQAIAGPQSNTLLVSWEQPSLPTAAARGYRVLVDGRQLQDVTNPLNDHTVINLNSLQHGRYLTVRTLTENEGESHDSALIDLEEISKKLDADMPPPPPLLPPTATVPLISEETFDKDSFPLTTSSSLTLRTLSDDEITNSESTYLPAMEPQTKPSRPPEVPSPPVTNVPSVRPAISTVSQAPTHIPSPPVKSPPTSNPDKIRPITKTNARPIGVPPIQSPSKSSTASSVSTDVPQIEINSPSPNSPVVTSKSKTNTRDQREQRFGYDAYMKQQNEPHASPPPPVASHIKSPGTQRKASKTSPTISPVKSREHSESKRAAATPINGNPSMNKTKMVSPRHTSTSSEEQQHVAPPMPMKPAKIPEQQIPPPAAPLINSHLPSKTTTPPRLFIALFDYDPNAMSPNKDNDEELPFKEGQLIRIYGDQDADGFYMGETENGRTGFVPSNMVSEIQLDDAEIEAHLFAGASNLENQTRQTASTTSTTTSAPSSMNTPKRINAGPSPPAAKSPPHQSIKKMVAMFDYNPNEHSPNLNPDEELSFRAGDTIYVHGTVHDDGFYLGELPNGSKGLVPSNFLKEVSALSGDEHMYPPAESERTSASETKKTSYRRGPHQV